MTELITPEEAAERKGVPEATLYSWIRRKLLPVAQRTGTGRRSLILLDADVVAAFIPPPAGRPKKDTT